MYESLNKSYLEQPQELSDLVDSPKIIHKYFPKQVDIDKILNIIKRKVLKGTHLLLTIKEIQAGYLSISFFKDLFVYLAHHVSNFWGHTWINHSPCLYTSPRNVAWQCGIYHGLDPLNIVWTLILLRPLFRPYVSCILTITMHCSMVFPQKT